MLNISTSNVSNTIKEMSYYEVLYLIHTFSWKQILNSSIFNYLLTRRIHSIPKVCDIKKVFCPSELQKLKFVSKLFYINTLKYTKIYNKHTYCNDVIHIIAMYMLYWKNWNICHILWVGWLVSNGKLQFDWKSW